MKTSRLALALIMAFSGPGIANEETIDLESRERSVRVIENRLKEREAQVKEISDDIIRLHKRIDGKLARIVDRLSNIKDSTKSGYRVSKLKMEAIEGLQKAIETFQTKRAAVLREMRERKSGVPKEQLEGDAEHFDEHIEKHIEQMLTISKSFTQDEDVKKYESIGGGGYSWSGWDDGLIQISDEWKQNRRDRTMNKKQRKEVVDALKSSVERCERLIAGLEDNLSKQNLSKADRELMESELKRHRGMLDTRRSQLYQMEFVDKPYTSEMSRDAARDLEDTLEEQTADIWRDLDTVFLKHTQLNTERARVQRLKANLKARKEWLAEYEAGKKP